MRYVFNSIFNSKYYIPRYIDSLLERLELFGISCHMGPTYAGVFGYSDNLALLAPSLRSQRMIK